MRLFLDLEEVGLNLVGLPQTVSCRLDSQVGWFQSGAKKNLPDCSLWFVYGCLLTSSPLYVHLSLYSSFLFL